MKNQPKAAYPLIAATARHSASETVHVHGANHFALVDTDSASGFDREICHISHKITYTTDVLTCALSA